MKRLFTCLMGLVLLSPLMAQIEVKDFSVADRHKRTIALGNSITLNAISIGKDAGMSVEEIATKMGDNWAKTWKKDAGLTVLANGFIWNNSSFLSEDQPKIEILEQSEEMVKCKFPKFWGGFFANGDVMGVSEKEYITFWDIAGQRIADYVGCKLETTDDGDFLIQTYRVK